MILLCAVLWHWSSAAPMVPEFVSRRLGGNNDFQQPVCSCVHFEENC